MILEQRVQPATVAVESGELWAAVDRLTNPSTRPVLRDDGTTTHAVVPSLWEQAQDALTTSMESSVRCGSSSERSPVDLGLMTVRDLIRKTTASALHARNVPPRLGTAAQLRQLASVVVATEPESLWWWSYRYESWARLLTTMLAVGEHRPSAVRLRNAPCPACGVRQVRVEGDEGEMVVAALVIEFANGYVQAAECSSCLATWWRGAQLEELAQSLGCAVAC